MTRVVVRAAFLLGPDRQTLPQGTPPRQQLGESPWTAFVLGCGGTREEALTVNFSEFVYWSVAEQNISVIRDLSPGERIQFESTLRLLYGGQVPFRTKWYETNKYRLNPDAVRYIDNLLPVRPVERLP